MMRVVLVAVGSAGDVYPFLGIGEALIERGHHVTVAASGRFADDVAAIGATPTDVLPEAQYDCLQELVAAGRSREAMRELGRLVFDDLTQAVVQTVAESCRQGRTAVVAQPWQFGARVAREVLRVPLITASIAPNWLKWGRTTWADWWRFPLATVARRLGESTLDRLAQRRLKRIWADWGLSAPSGPVHRWWHSPDGSVALYPDWYDVGTARLCGKVERVGFPLYDASYSRPIHPAIERFLASGPPPVVVSHPSWMTDVREYASACESACRQLGRRVLILSGSLADEPTSTHPDCLYAPYAPFGPLLPRCALLVHGGGIGTVAAATAAGVPQLLVPDTTVASDRLNNSRIVRRLGIGTSIRRGLFNDRRARRAIQQILEQPGYRRRADELAQLCHPLAAREAVCRIVEATADDSRQQPRRPHWLERIRTTQAYSQRIAQQSAAG